MLLRAARILGGPDRPRDVLIESGRITAFDPGDVAGAEAVELEGRYLAPGLWDYHVHMDQWALRRQRVDLAGAESPDEVARRFGERLAAENGAAHPLVGYGFRDALWSQPPHRDILDALPGSRPVVAVSGDLHCVWLNGAAAASFGLGGHTSGVLREQAAIEVLTSVNSVPDELLDAWVAQAARAAARRGIVGIVELEWADNIARWTRRVRAGVTQLRVRCGVYPDALDAAIASGLRTGDTVEGTRGLVTLGPLKVITDGSLNTRTALCADPYPRAEGGPHPHGVANIEHGELIRLMRLAARHGIDCAIHAIGDRANSLALDAFAEVGCAGSIEHAQLVAEADFARFGELRLVASVQPEHALDDRDVADRLWRDRTDRAFAFHSLMAGGARLALGSDAPVAPLDPWITMAAAIARSRGGRPPWHPEQALTAAEAFAASHEGSLPLRVGQAADLVVLDSDPLKATPDELRAFSVAGTLLGGEWTHPFPA